MLATQLGEPRGVVGGHRHEATLALHRLEEDTGDALWVDLRLEELAQTVERVVARHPAIRVRGGSTVNLRRERPEAGLVRVHLARHRHRQQRSSVECIVEDDNGRPARRGARDLHGVLVRLRAGVDEDRLLVRTGARRELREKPARPDIRLVHADHEALVQVAVGLLLDRIDDGREPVAGVLAADAACEVEEDPAVRRR